MNVAQIIDQLQKNEQFKQNLTAWNVIPAEPARYASFPPELDKRLIHALSKNGIYQLYTHQAEAVESAFRGENLCIVTPTASGKTLCYNLPVLQEILKNPSSRALYLFPTKALSQDQVHELKDISEKLEIGIRTYTFDGDTPTTARQAIRSAGQIVVTNPDMLHTGILPHHTIWIHLFENLKYVVIDEIHYYRGVLGSHLANILRRLKRIASFYGSNPQYICCSATIANPKELAEKLIEAPVTLIDKNGAPRSEKHFLFYNPPVIDRDLGIRKSSTKEATRIASELISKDIQTIIFARSRLQVEIVTTYLKDMARHKNIAEHRVCGYRGGYLPTERRAIEEGLRKGDILSVVSTNALELGIDIGSLDACIMVGYSGSISSTWQQAGRAGRRQGTSLVILVASSSPLDQFIVTHPEYFFSQTAENATLDPNNLYILTSHLKCAAFELPFMEGEIFGLDEHSTQAILEFLEEQHILHKVKKQWHWSAESYPAQDISLRTAAPGNVVILDSQNQGRVIGEVDYFSAPSEVFENAIYIHQSETYTIEHLDLEDRKAYARAVETDYYTDAELKVDLGILNPCEEREEPLHTCIWGELKVTWLPTIYKKIKFGTHENVGWGEIHLPEQTMHTLGYWIELSDTLIQEARIPEEHLSDALVSLVNTLRQVAPVQVLCDPADIRAHAMLKAPISQKPTLFLYERYPGGVGLSEKLFHHHYELIKASLSLLESCPCRNGCPSCVGPAIEIGSLGKQHALQLAQALRHAQEQRNVIPFQKRS
ncbi:MAG: DEAD/DEAH box helicase [Candidatus Hydrogenedens sp.]|nr:DEAD/DEAH box helicase [Candidatus Hydrogenedens sp.]